MPKTALFALVCIVLPLTGCITEPDPAVAQAKLSTCSRPDPRLTPGDLCTDTDPNFDGYRYAERIPHCRRNVTKSEKQRIGASYGVPASAFGDYEFDHLIPLSIGGSDAPSNVWPEPLDDASDKDQLEFDLYLAVRDGRTTQPDAVAQILAWRPRCAD